MSDGDKTPWWAFNKRKFQRNVDQAVDAFGVAVNGEPGDLTRFGGSRTSPGDSKFCSNCGNRVTVNANYCNACGAAQ